MTSIKTIMRSTIQPVFMTVFVFMALSSLGAINPTHLRCEYHVNPLGLDVLQPRLSWQLESDERNQQQSAYRILVASSPEKLEKNEGDLWDSGDVRSDESIQIVYEGKPLRSRRQCWWKVVVMDQDGKASDWSEPAMWSMGLLNPEDWTAQWIGFDKIPELTEEPVLEEPEIVMIKALYGPSEQPTNQVNLKEKIAKLVASGTYTFKMTNEFASGDPADGAKKTLALEYTLQGKPTRLTFNENADVNLVTAKVQKLLNRRYLPAPHLRKEFQVKGPVKRAVVYVTAQGFAEMHLNGRRVGDEFFTPGWTDYNKRIYYRTYDVTDLVQPGGNAIAGIIGDGWFRGNVSNLGQYQYGHKIRLRSQLHIDYADGRTEIVATDPSWKAAFGPILESDMHEGETYDARLEMPGWDRPGFDDRKWAAVDTDSDLNSQPLIQAYPGVPVRRTQELPVVKRTALKNGVQVFDLGQNFSGWVRLKVSGQAGDKIVMKFGEMLNPDGSVHTKNLRSARATDTYILKGGGEEVWEPHFTFHGFQYVEVTGLRNDPPADTLTGIVVYSDAPMTSSFECSNPMLNQLLSNILWGQRSNYLEVPTDCPQRDERLGWTGDTQVYIRSGTYHQDVASFFTKWLVDLEDTLNDRNLYGKQAPVMHGRGSPGWSDAGIICPWTVYHVYGDTRVIEKHYDGMTRYMKACGRKGLDGLGKGFGDWLSVGSKTPLDVISVAYYAYSTHLMAEMAEAIGKKEDAATYQDLFERIRDHFQASFVDADGRVKGNTQTAYCMALHYNLLTEKQRKQAADHLVERIKAKDYHLSVGFLGVPILLPTLTEIGRSDLAYRLLQNKTYPSWGYSVEQGATTIWERWNSYTHEGGISKSSMNSFNHYAYGACSEWMFYSMLGIDLESPGFKEIKMKPEVGHGITWAKGFYDSIRGRISSDWKIEDGIFHWKVTVPANTTATLHFPAGSTSELTEGGRMIPRSKFKLEDNRVMLSVGSGTYTFAAHLTDHLRAGKNDEGIGR
ncbi:glycoside hydrolase family 78 protein [Pontiellaceae bacterium B12227]|nr:glycoside hydrolase family 78 protein [Pontiellaceae bacterium B12227]